MPRLGTCADFARHAAPRLWFLGVFLQEVGVLDVGYRNVLWALDKV